MRWTPGLKYAYRKPGSNSWKLASCKQDGYTGVIVVAMGNAEISVNRPSWFADYEWRGPLERKSDTEDAPVFVPPGTL